MESFLSHLQSLDEASCSPQVPSAAPCVPPLGNLFCTLSPHYGTVSSFAFPPELPPPIQMPMPGIQPLSVQFAAAAAAAASTQSYCLHSQMPMPQMPFPSFQSPSLSVPMPPQMLQYISPQGGRGSLHSAFALQSSPVTYSEPQASPYFNPLQVQQRQPLTSNNSSSNSNNNNTICGGAETQDANVFALNPQLHSNSNGAPASPTRVLSLSLTNEFAVGATSANASANTSASGEQLCARGQRALDCGAGAQQPLLALSSAANASGGAQQSFGVGGSVSACTDATSDVLGLVGIDIRSSLDHYSTLSTNYEL